MLDKEKLKQAGIDYEAAIKRFAGKEELYEKYLYRYDEDNHFGLAYEAFQKKDYACMLEEVHTLKGIAGTLGITVLFDSCQAIVCAIRQEDYEPLGELFERMTACYQNMEQTIKGEKH